MAIGELISALTNSKGGRPVTGERFVGRKKIVERILRDFLLDEEGNNMAIYGLPRIGKTSIVKEVIRQYQNSNRKQDYVCPIYLGLRPVEGWSIPQIFHFILNGIWEELSEIEMENSTKQHIQGPLDEIKSKLLEGDVDTSVVVTTFQNFFFRCQKKGFSLRLVFDEYDSVMPTFFNKKGCLDTVGLNAFNGAIRKVIEEDKYGTRILFITRNRLSEMEPEGVSSRLMGLCGDPIMIKPFSSEDVEAYWSRLSKYDSDGFITEAHKEKIKYYAGNNYPYWMNLVNSILFEAINMAEEEKDTILRISSTIRDEYKSVLDMLDASCYLDSGRGSLRNKLIQVVLGISYDVQKTDIDSLMNYGILEKDGGNYRSLSPFFHDYLDFQNMQTPVWAHLGRFEKSMRELINFFILKTGKSLEDGTIVPLGLLGELKKRRTVMCNNFGDSSVSDNLVDYFFTSNYFDLFVNKYWEWFKDVFVSFHGDLQSCAEQFHYLEKCRNAEGHFNGNFLGKDVVAKVEQYCISLSDQAERFLSENSL